MQQTYVIGGPAQLGFQSDSQYLHKPKQCSYNIQIKQAACGDCHTHLLSTEGHVYSMGLNQGLVLGVGIQDFQ